MQTNRDNDDEKKRLNATVDFPLTYQAAYDSELDTLRFLIEESGASVAVPPLLDLNLWHYACSHPLILAYLTNTDLKIYERFNDGTATVHALAIMGKIPELDELLKANPDLLNQKTNRQEYLFYWAAMTGQNPLIEHVLKTWAVIISPAMRNAYLLDCVEGATHAAESAVKKQLYQTAINYYYTIIEYIGETSCQEDLADDVNKFQQEINELNKVILRHERKATRQQSSKREINPRIQIEDHKPEAKPQTPKRAKTLTISTEHEMIYENYKKAAEQHIKADRFEHAIEVVLVMLRYATHIQQVSMCNMTLYELYFKIQNYTLSLEFAEKEIEHFQKYASDTKQNTETLFTLIEKKEQLLKLLDSSREETITRSMQLKQSASQWGFNCLDVKRDGNCFFYAICDQIASQEYSPVIAQAISGKNNMISAKLIRLATVNHLLHNRHFYTPFLDTDKYADFDAYLEKMSEDTEWADELAINATVRALKIALVIIALEDDRLRIFKVREPAAIFFIGHEPELHYQSLRRNTTITPVKNIETIIATTLPLEELPELPPQAPTTEVPMFQEGDFNLDTLSQASEPDDTAFYDVDDEDEDEIHLSAYNSDGTTQGGYDTDDAEEEYVTVHPVHTIFEVKDEADDEDDETAPMPIKDGPTADLVASDDESNKENQAVPCASDSPSSTSTQHRFFSLPTAPEMTIERPRDNESTPNGSPTRRNGTHFTTR